MNPLNLLNIDRGDDVKAKKKVGSHREGYVHDKMKPIQPFSSNVNALKSFIEN